MKKTDFQKWQQEKIKEATDLHEAHVKEIRDNLWIRQHVSCIDKLLFGHTKSQADLMIEADKLRTKIMICDVLLLKPKGLKEDV